MARINYGLGRGLRIKFGFGVASYKEEFLRPPFSVAGSQFARKTAATNWTPMPFGSEGPTGDQFYSGPHVAVATGAGTIILQARPTRAVTAVGIGVLVKSINITRSVIEVATATRTILTQKLFAATATGVPGVITSLLRMVLAGATAVGVASLQVSTSITMAVQAVGIGLASAAATFLASASATAIGLATSVQTFFSGTVGGLINFITLFRRRRRG